VKGVVEIVDVFRKSEDVLDIVHDSLNKSGVRIIWLQEGIHNQEAEEMARSRGIDVIYNRCMMAEHIRLFEN
jgi:predicted CoA-binding protein